MYSLKQKQLAVETYNQLNSTRKTIRCLGYPSRATLSLWIEEFKEYGSLSEPQYNRLKQKYSVDQIKYAVDYCCQHGMNISKTCRDIGYPCRTLLSRWLDERVNNHKKSVLKGSTLKKYSYNDKVVASIHLACRDGTAKDVAEDSLAELRSHTLH